MDREWRGVNFSTWILVVQIKVVLVFWTESAVQKIAPLALCIKVNDAYLHS